MAFAERKGEKIGGGFFVMRRGKKTGRVGVRSTTLPFEHPSLEAAVAEAERLTRGNAGECFAVFQQVYVSEPSMETIENDH